MFKYICKRIGLMLMTFTIIFTVCFVLIKLLPIDTSTVPIGEDANKIKATMEARGYFKPIPEQFVLYIKRILKGDFGIGINMPQYRNLAVWDVFTEKLPPTILINVYSSLIAVPTGIALGILAALAVSPATGGKKCGFQYTEGFFQLLRPPHFPLHLL